MNWQETLTQLEAGTVRAATQDAQGNRHLHLFSITGHDELF